MKYPKHAPDRASHHIAHTTPFCSAPRAGLWRGGCGDTPPLQNRAKLAQSARLAQPSRRLPAALCRACLVKAAPSDRGIPPMRLPRSLSASREAAHQAPDSPIWADLGGAAFRGLQSYPALGPELHRTGTGPGGLRGAWDVTGRGTPCSENQRSAPCIVYFYLQVLLRRLRRLP